MSDWTSLIPKCFGREDLVFAGTPDEYANAVKLRTEIKKDGVCPELLESAIEDWLHTETSNTGQLFEQMARVRAFFEDKTADHRSW
jgi:hypothetical protein